MDDPKHPDDVLPVAYAGLQGLSWVTPNEMRLLAQIVGPSTRLLEVGTACGVTAAKLVDLTGPREVVCVDTFADSDDPAHAEHDRDRWARWKANARPAMRLWYGDLASFARVATPRSFDVVFVDADHTLPGVMVDLCLARELVKPGGFVLAHDYGDPYWPDVTRAVDAFRQSFDFAVRDRRGSLVVMQQR